MLKGIVPLVVVLAGLGAWPAGAGAIIIVGSDLSDPPITINQTCAPAAAPCTFLPFAVNAGNAFPVKSPANGTVTSFTIKSGTADTVTFRLGRYGKGGTTARGDGTGPTVALPSPGTFTVPASVPIKAGDYVGIDSSLHRAYENLPCTGTGGTFIYNPILPNAGPFQVVDANAICELMVRAAIVPSNVISLNKAILKLKGSSARLPVTVPGPGKLKLKGAGVAPRSAGDGAVTSQKVKKAGKATLKIKPRGKTKSKLERSGRARVKVRITFSPKGGTPRTIKRTLTLKS